MVSAFLAGCTLSHFKKPVAASVAPANPTENLQRPVLTVAGVVHVCPANKIALIERGKAPFGFAMFGGHVEHESPEAAFRRELKEELQVNAIDNLSLVGVHGNPGRDPRQHSVEVTYSCTTFETPHAASDAKKVHLFTADNLRHHLTKEKYAFDHKLILTNYLDKIKNCNPCQQRCK